VIARRQFAFRRTPDQPPGGIEGFEANRAGVL